MKYKYVAKTLTGQTMKGVADASSEKAAAELLKEQKLVPIKIESTKEKVSIGSVNKMLGRVSVGDLANFTRQLATMVTAGLPLTDALDLLRIQSSPVLIPVISQVLADVQGGQSLSSALAKHPKVFSKVYVALIKAGEAAGVMEKIMLRLADNAEKSREFRSKVIGALIYPVIIIFGMIGVVAVMVLIVIPKLSALYADFGAELPLATRIVIGTSDFAVKFWPLLLAGGVGLWLFLRSVLASEQGRKQWDTLFYKLPVIGQLSREVMLTEMTRTLSLLVGAGVPVVESLHIVSEAAGNVVVREQINEIGSRVEKGFPVSISFSEASVFPAIVGQMVAVGEETGKLDEVLAKVSHYFEAESEEKIKGLTTAIEPIILIILAVGVGFLMYAIIMPIYTITDKI